MSEQDGKAAERKEAFSSWDVYLPRMEEEMTNITGVEPGLRSLGRNPLVGIIYADGYLNGKRSVEENMFKMSWAARSAAVGEVLMMLEPTEDPVRRQDIDFVCYQCNGSITDPGGLIEVLNVDEELAALLHKVTTALLTGRHVIVLTEPEAGT